MAALLDIRRRIRSVKSTQQITRAMKMVAAARLRKAQDRIFNARPYANQMMALLSSVAARTTDRCHPLLQERPIKRQLLVLVTSDRGLCGGFNANLIRAAQSYVDEHRDREISIIAVGRKGRDYYRRRGAKILAEHINLPARPSYQEATGIAREVIRRYRDGETDAVFVLNNEFKSVMSQKLSVLQLLPLAGETKEIKDYIYEQSPVDMLDRLVPRYVEAAVFRALLETIASYQAARMTAMDKASSNARDVIDTLTLNMNRIRQAAITKEIIEVVSGAAAAE